MRMLRDELRGINGAAACLHRRYDPVCVAVAEIDVAGSRIRSTVLGATSATCPECAINNVSHGGGRC